MFFEKPGPENTKQTLKAAFERGRDLELNEAVFATTTGETAYKAMEIFSGFRLIAVTYHGGFREPFENVMATDVRRDLESKGVTVISATHALSGVERSIAKKHSGLYPVLLIADTLKRFGQGTKVAVEVSIMAADAGVLTGKDIVAVGGSAKGADTALVLAPANQSNFFDMKIKEIVCKPRNF
ncbi:MAG: pyruvate kinase alpha/beta domain-containing protein [Desulfobacterales bacterium]